MKVQVVETTDEQHIGLSFELPKVGDTLILGDEKWEILGVEFDKPSGLWKIWNFNYCSYCQEIKEGDN